MHVFGTNSREDILMYLHLEYISLVIVQQHICACDVVAIANLIDRVNIIIYKIFLHEVILIYLLSLF